MRFEAVQRTAVKTSRTSDDAATRFMGPALFLIAVGSGSFVDLLHAADETPPFGLEHRIPWTTSRVAGSPDPPLPYTVEKTFTNIRWRAPIFATAEPGTDRLLVVQAGGEKERPSKSWASGMTPAPIRSTFLV